MHSKCIYSHHPSPPAVVDGTVLLASIGATVAAGVTVLKIGFCREVFKKKQQHHNKWKPKERVMQI